MPKIKVNDINMYYEIHGKGYPLVLISGFGADHLMWFSILEKFTDYYQVILFDNRGAGQTDVPEGPYSIRQMADDVAGLCKTLNIEKANFIGNSMGGYIVQMLAYYHADLIKSIVISNSAMSTDTPFHIYVAAQLALLKAKAPLASLLKASCAWAFSFQYLSQPGRLEELIQWGLNNPHPFTTTGYQGQYAAIDNFNSHGWINKVNCPTLVIGGDQDLIFNKKLFTALVKKINNATYFCFKNCGHLPHLEYPEKYSRIVKKFLEKIQDNTLN